MKGALVDKELNTKTAYSVEILKYDDIENKIIKNWINEKKDRGVVDGNKVFYSLRHDDPNAPMDVYVYMPSAKDVIGDINLSNFKTTESGTALFVYIDADSDIPRTKDGTDLILHIYVEDANASTKARTERLIINGETYTSCESKSTNLK